VRRLYGSPTQDKDPGIIRVLKAHSPTGDFAAVGCRGKHDGVGPPQHLGLVDAYVGDEILGGVDCFADCDGLELHAAVGEAVAGSVAHFVGRIVGDIGVSVKKLSDMTYSSLHIGGAI
jgi:hypothetical protein